MNKNKTTRRVNLGGIYVTVVKAPATPLERELKAARSLEKLLASLPKKLNVKPEPTYKFNPHLPGTKL
jgi:hypothetical protein